VLANRHDHRLQRLGRRRFSQSWIIRTGITGTRMIVYGLWGVSARSPIGVGLLPVLSLAALVRPAASDGRASCARRRGQPAAPCSPSASTRREGGVTLDRLLDRWSKSET
jgi:hypothetical protein